MENRKVNNIIQSMMGVSMVGFILNFILGNTAKPAFLAVLTLGLVIISLLISVFIPLSLEKNNEMLNNLPSFFNNNITVFFTLFLAVWSITIHSTNFERINEGNVPNDFSGFRLLSMIAIALQVTSVFISLLYPKRENSSKMLKTIILSPYPLTALNVMLLSILHVIIVLFTTDG